MYMINIDHICPIYMLMYSLIDMIYAQIWAQILHVQLRCSRCVHHHNIYELHTHGHLAPAPHLHQQQHARPSLPLPDHKASQGCNEVCSNHQRGPRVHQFLSTCAVILYQILCGDHTPTCSYPCHIPIVLRTLGPHCSRPETEFIF